MVNDKDVSYLFDEVLSTSQADLNLDGEVGFVDFLVLSTNFGRLDAKWSQGDINGDQQISFVDFLLLSEAFTD